MTIEKIEETRGVDVLQDWDNFFANKMADYYTVKEMVIGDWFTIDKTLIQVEEDPPTATLQALNSTKLPLLLRSIRRDIIVVGVVAGVGIKGNPYNFTNKRAFIVDIFDKTRGIYYTPQELTQFANMISINPYGQKYTPGPIVGLVDFKAAVQAVKDLEDPNTAEIESQVQASLNMLLHRPSSINPEMDQQGLLFSGLTGYKFNYS